MFGFGVAINANDHFLLFEPKIGLIINTIGKTKLKIEHQLSSNHLSFNSIQTHSSAIFSWFYKDNITINTLVRIKNNNLHTKKEFSVGVEYHF